MSSPAPGGSDGRDDRRHSIGKYVKRMRTVLKRGSPSRDSTTMATAGSSSSAPTIPKAAAPEPAKTTDAPEAPKPAVSTTDTSYAKHINQQERARALFAKYGLTLEPHEWITTGKAATNVQRVEKPIRMRVHRTCHRCQTTFGADKICVKCEHKRCKKCPRYPAKRSKEAKDKAAAKIAVDDQPATADFDARPLFLSVRSREFITVRPRAPGSLEAKPIKQRIRRTCHKCDALFQPPTAIECTNCKHVRCTKCPRDPPKLKKWPNGYPGDAPAEDSEKELGKQLFPKVERMWRKPRQRVRWTCESCSKLYKEGSKTCEGCGHERCENCTRIPPKKIKKEPDPEVVRAVEEKLAALKVRDTSEPEAATTAAAA